MLVVYFSNVTNNTHRFVEKLDVKSARIPIRSKEEPLFVTEPYVLVVPTYAGGRKGKGAVPPQVVKFLNVEQNRKLCKAVVGTGNTNFGTEYCAAAFIVSRKLEVPVIGLVEIFGTPEDVNRIKDEIGEVE